MLVEVSKLYGPDFLIEIEAIAAARSPSLRFASQTCGSSIAVAKSLVVFTRSEECRAVPQHSEH
jgi:hypothetical protein